MDFKTGKLHKIIREFKRGSGIYEINGIDIKNTVFLYREKAGAFTPIPKGNYKITFSNNENILEVDDFINNKAIEFQIISLFDIQSSKYLEEFPELKMVVIQTNKIVDDINNIIGYLNSVGVKADSKYQTQILTPLEPLSVWYMNAEGNIDTLPIDDFNKKFKEIVEKMSELADEKAQEKVKARLEELKNEIDNFKNDKVAEVLKNIEAQKNKLDSKIPEINKKFNAIVGGQINYDFIQDSIEKIEGQYYLDRNTSKLYKCIKTTSSIINSVEYFKDTTLDSIFNKLENLSTFKVQDLYSTPTGIKFTVFQCGKLILIAAYTYNIEQVNYGITYKCSLPYNCHNTASSITGNNGTSGHFSLVNNILMVSSTDVRNPLTNTFMGQLITFLK